MTPEDDIIVCSVQLSRHGRNLVISHMAEPIGSFVCGQRVVIESAVARAEREFGWDLVVCRWTKHTAAEAKAEDRERWLGEVVALLYERLSAQAPRCPHGNMPASAGSGHWREWHRGHGCHLDPDRSAP